MSKVYTINTGNKSQFLSEYALVTGSNLTGSFTGSLTGRLTGTASWAESASRAITVAPNSVALGTDTTGNYVGTLTQGRGITVLGGTGEGTGNTILLGSGSSAYNISGSGNWFTVARRVGSNGRGITEVFIYSSGGDTAPAHMKLLWNTDWGGVSSIRVVNNTFLPSTLIIGAIRATYTGSTQTAELEVQSTSAGNATINSIVVDYSTAGSPTTPIVTASANLPTSVQIPMSYFYDGVIMSSGSNVGIGTLTPSASLDVPFAGGIGRPTMLFGATDGGFTRTDATQKIFRLAGAHYTNAQTPYTVIMGVGDSANNEVRIGGGTSQLNGATIVSFWTTGSNTAPAQNYRWQITADGIFQSNGAQTIRSSTGNLTLAAGGGNGHILLTPDGTGNVGIGTTNPVSKLQIQGNVSASSYTSSINNTVGFFGTSSWAVSSSGTVSTSRADSSARVDVLSGGSTTAVGIYSGSFFGTSSWSNTASFALNATSGAGFPFSGSAVITGTLLVSGAVANSISSSGNIAAGTNLISNNSSGDEGGEILLAKPQTNSTIDGTGVTIDVFQNKLRFFEQGGSARGFFVDMTSGSGAAGTNLQAAASAVSTYTNASDNRVITSTGAGGINAESTLTYDGTVLSISTNNAKFLQGGDDSALYDVNVANTLGIHGQQDSTVGAIKLGSSGQTIYSNATGVGIGTITPGALLHVQGNVSASSFTGSLFGTASWAQNTISSSFASLSANITATSNTTLTSLANLATVGTITSGIWSGSTVSIGYGGTGATTAATARVNLDVPRRANLVITGSLDNTLRAGDTRNITNPSASIGFMTGMRIRFSSLNDNSTSPYADVIDLSTYSDGTGGGYNSLYFHKTSQQIIHKFATVNATSWTSKSIAYTDSNIIGTSSWASSSISSSFATTASAATSITFTPNTASFATTASHAVSSSRADSSATVDILSGGSSTALGIYSGSFSGSFFGNLGGGSGAGFPYAGDAVITGSLLISGSGLRITGSTTTSGSILPAVDNLFNLGSSTNRWANLYTGDLNLSNEGSMGNIVDGTTGNWTIQEGEEYLYIINKKSGKRYRFMLEEVE